MTRPASPIVLYRHPISGHAHRAEAMLALLGLPYEMVDVDLMKGEQRSLAFLALNPFGEVPVIRDGDVVVADSNAILVYLATRYDETGRWLPREPVAAARVQRWLTVAAGALAFGAARARINALFGRPDDQGPRDVAVTMLGRMESHLASQRFLAGDEATIADIAMYAYTARAPEGGVSLEPWPAVVSWLSSLEALPSFPPMIHSAAPKKG